MRILLMKCFNMSAEEMEPRNESSLFSYVSILLLFSSFRGINLFENKRYFIVETPGIHETREYLNISNNIAKLYI